MDGASAVTACYASSVPERIGEKKPVSGLFPAPALRSPPISLAGHGGRRGKRSGIPAATAERAEGAGKGRHAFQPEGASPGGHGWHRQSFTCHNSCMDSSGYLLFPRRGSSGDRASPDTKKGGLSVAFRYWGNVGWNEPAGPRPAWRSVRYWTPRARSGCRGRSGGSFRVPQR